MKTINYEQATIENIQALYKTGRISEIIFDGDNKKIGIKEDEYLVIEETFNQLINAAETVADAVCEVAKKMIETVSLIYKNMCDKKITKKKFIKLLRSEGIDRYTIDEIVKDNKEPYTYIRYYEILSNFKR